MYDRYNNLLIQYYLGGSSGGAIASRELLNVSSIVDWATFGSGTAGTNQTLRIQGSNGYQDWRASLQVGTTSTEDFRNASPKNVYDDLQPHYYFTTYGQAS